MIKYPHFALSNLYLESGYRLEQSAYGEVVSYQNEEGLEDCVRRILARSPKRLTGRDLRFLRKGLELSQEAFGALVDKDAQTIARIEKSADAVPRLIDLAIRARFFERREPNKSVGEIMGIHDLSAKVPQERVILFLQGGRWNFRYDVPQLRIQFIDSDELDAVLSEETDGNFTRRILSLSTQCMREEEDGLSTQSSPPRFSSLSKQSYASSN